MLKNCKFADVTFVLNGGDEIRAHSQFLIAQSSVFAEMIEDQYSKKEKTLRIEIDIKKEAFEELLKYVYTGHCSIMDYFVQELLMAANKVRCSHFNPALNITSIVSFLTVQIGILTDDLRCCSQPECDPRQRGGDVSHCRLAWLGTLAKRSLFSSALVSVLLTAL